MELSIIDLTRETVVCSRCKKKQDDDNPLNREHWKQVRTQSRRTVTVCGKCYTYYVEKSKISQTSTAERSSSHTTGHVQSVRKLVADSQRGIGHARVHAISPLLPNVGGSLSSKGYTKNHLEFANDFQRHQRRASGSGASEVIVKVILNRPISKGPKVALQVVDPDLTAHVPVFASIGAHELHQKCVTAILSTRRWGDVYNRCHLPVERTSIEHKGVPVFGAKDCILQYFAKKSRSGTGIKTYNFSIPLDLNLVIENAFYEEVFNNEQQQPGASAGEAMKDTVSQIQLGELVATSSKQAMDTCFNTLRRPSESRVTRPVPKRKLQAKLVTAVATEPEQRHVSRLERSLSDFQLGDTGTRSKRSREDSEEVRSTKRPRSEFYIPSLEDLQSAIQSQGSSHQYLTRFSVAIKVIPTRSWSPKALVPLDLLRLPSIRCHMDVDIKVVPSLKGAFKTAHPGSITPIDGVLPLPLSSNICVKQVYFPGQNNKINRYGSKIEQNHIHSEVGCLDWARILLDLTYGFIEDHEETHGGFPGTIPKLRFVEAAIAESKGGEKFFLIEEWIDTSDAPFMKYINNARPVSCIPRSAPEEIQNTANFLCFAQHVQYHVTKGTVFTSDYQGVLLTDPQIISTPELGRLFARGNCNDGISKFRVDHECNHFCEYFGLKSPVPFF